MRTRGLSLLVGLGFACLALQIQSCSSNSETEGEQPTDGSGGSQVLDSSTEGGHGGSAGTHTGGSGGKAGSGGSGGSGGSQDGAGGGKGGSAGAHAGSGGAAGAAGKGGSAGSHAGNTGAGGSAGHAGNTGGEGGADADIDAPADAPEEAAQVCTLQTNVAACQPCMLTNCNDSCLACETNPFCQAIIVCVLVCTDDACKKKCWDNNKDGQDDFNALASQSGCLHDHCVNECPGLPNTGGCTIAAGRTGDPGWLMFAAMLGLGTIALRKRNRRQG